MPAAQVVENYNSKVSVSSGEAVTLDFVYAATRVHESIFSKPNLVSLVLWAFSSACIIVFAVICITFKGPGNWKTKWLLTSFHFQAEEEMGKRTVFDSIYKLDLFLRKSSKNEQTLEWILNTCCHLVQTGVVGSLNVVLIACCISSSTYAFDYLDIDRDAFFFLTYFDLSGS